MDYRMEQQDFMSGEQDVPRTPREKRVALAREKQMVRSALLSAARHGYYAFDELITEDAGLIDFLVVGPLFASVILVLSERGRVRLDRDRDVLQLDGRDLEEDPREWGSALVDDVDKKVFENTYNTRLLICYLYAELEPDENNLVPHGTTPIWELPWALDPEGVENLNSAQIEEIAEKIQEVYGRPPIVRPDTAAGEF